MPVIEVSVDGSADAENELRSLLRWLMADEETGPHTHGRLTSSTPARPDHMGTALDLITLSVGAALSAAQLALAVHQWRAHRRGSPTVTLTRGDLSVEIRSGDTETVRRLTELLAEGQGGDDGAA